MALRRPALTLAIATLLAAAVAATPAGQDVTNTAPLFDRDATVREEAVRALGAGGARSLPLLLGALFDSDRRVRDAAIEALTDVGGSRALEVLAAAVHDPDAELRENVVYAAERIGGSDAATVVELLAADPVAAVRDAAAAVLRDLAGGREAGRQNSTRRPPVRSRENRRSVKPTARPVPMTMTPSATP